MLPTKLDVGTPGGASRLIEKVLTEVVVDSYGAPEPREFVSGPTQIVCR